ncbi:iron-containing alcohol dehydrogenase [Coriobacterium glomerans PW2]|uniref:Iron-containing alcohol dehydrogenase n=1 Tax=Coriobacterium glomerans (strain ATCC 49209 / DSM 20642 / JCM 10262 / PW2) TaxID=700015 RepID=F2NA53_CORGP|nr:iron-containing alcohol dehydrogenase [Coriobacterium glomerans]AEB06447.1 iron-containing alcohol dehydrogenase [Coriobacterium glomerans PW2]
MLESYALKLPGSVIAGKDALGGLTGILEMRSAEHVALFCDAAIWNLGLAEPVLEVIRRTGARVDVTRDLVPEPTYHDVERSVAWFRATGAEIIVAIGGGSAMDAAKLASVLATDEYSITDLLEDPSLARKQTPTVMIPTTAGTGAEVTPNAIVAVPERELKIGIVSDAMMADAVILDVEFIRGLPRPIAAATGLDALCHAIECYTSTKANPFSDIFALEALDLILSNIEAACDDVSALEAKRAMQLASFYAGFAITASGTTAVHALSYPLGGRYHVAHGVSNAILLMPVMRFNEPVVRARLAVAYDRCIGGEATTEREKSAALLDRMDAIVRHLDMPANLAELGVDEVDLDGLVASGMGVTRLLHNNARPLTAEDARAIYQQII